MLRRPTKTALFSASALIALAAAACDFGVSFDGIFGGSASAGDGGTDAPSEASGTEGGVPKVEVVQLSLGNAHACARRVDGTVMCWGYDGPESRLGDKGNLASSIPVLVVGINDAIDVAAGATHSCVVRKNGTVSCWGDNTQRQIGDGTTTPATTPVPVVGLSDVKQVISGEAFSCALKNDGSVVCWGFNQYGELGDGTAGASRSAAVPVVGVSGATQIAAMRFGACAIVANGEVMCWGSIGTGAERHTASKIDGVTGATAIGSGSYASHACAATPTATLCWGQSSQGQLGDGKNTPSEIAVTAVGVVGATSLGAGNEFSCAALNTGSVNCWGVNRWLELGVGDEATVPANALTPVPVLNAGTPIADVKQISVGGEHVCALMKGGLKILCWGDNYYGVLGRNTRIASELPIKLDRPAVTKKLSLATNHGCSLDDQGALTCWGANPEGQIGPNIASGTGTPTLVNIDAGSENVMAAVDHTCVFASGTMRCFGRGYEGQLGDGMGGASSLPRTWGISPITAGAAGGQESCGRDPSGKVFCSGQNNQGQIGAPIGPNAQSPTVVVRPLPPPPDAGADADDSGANPDATLPPTSAPFAPLDAVFIGGVHACATHDNGKFACWGAKNEGQCGPTSMAYEVPEEVPLPGKVITASLGANHTCVVLEDGSVRCWGRNLSGQLSGGDPTGGAPRTPDLGGQTAKAIATGDDHTCVILGDDTVSCWGQGIYGQLGNGVRVDSNRPTVVPGLTGVASLYAGGAQTCALTNDGTRYCWGLNWFGQLGDGSLMRTGTPGPVTGYE